MPFGPGVGVASIVTTCYHSRSPEPKVCLMISIFDGLFGFYL